jgi:hypothetical protein
MEKQMNSLILFLFIFQFFLACVGGMLGQVFDEKNINGAFYLQIDD